ncbi:hypothetical protein CO178_00925 [candidate division WWE3 bacterium CG_4_9_14_3_um_filter_34_6]|uniref:Major facilitator superfamily (MFS) profile domain-containing protein n=1 Tax=candidate division WWE3 bacterium CG_4_9_14_3_um_filter_34_6 TaxID=1975079 RepID=A0A2M7X512_UNCKA|nr:MAG: hypothetical protein CO178_00925 [candidate division WWE3 bacterium CG_4_9_14_3_um_filter_34_6]
MLPKYIDLLSSSTDIIIKTFLIFYIWQATNNLAIVATFGLVYFAVIPFSSLLSGIFIDRIGTKLPHSIGILIQISQLFFIISYSSSNLSISTILFIAILMGIADGIKSMSLRTIMETTRDHRNEALFYANKTISSQFVELILVLSGALLVGSQLGYNYLFAFTLVILTIELIITIMLPQPSTISSFDIKSILTFPGTNIDKLTLVKAIFMEGLQEGVTLTILPIITLAFIGTIAYWGLLNTALVLLSLLFAFILSKLITDPSSHLLYGIGSIVFATTSLVFLIQYNFYVLAIFLMAQSLMGVIKNTSYFASIDNIMAQDINEYNLLSEYQFLINIVSSTARSIPLIIILLVGITIHDETSLRLILLFTGLVPLLAISFFGQSLAFKSSG